ncbi:hypothetical protein J7T55_015693 [Diaporthe amygdali]|uniref:uncharacterized protein n=1 Tax=Phomopsis amygdali TaxID=1214568 RepID=UPI0022FE962E|nr:uncharacterized protein J7T55_015693 [Diaporthe amygdali]KAJ0120954.1 hypothetical protein J7T55_015693 [Diaporthe amygdali]
MQDLHSIITSAFLRQMCLARVPWPSTHHISGKELVTEFFSDDYRFLTAAKAAWPVLKAITQAYGPNTIPDMTYFLPSPEVHEFPEQAFGMHVLLDQAPRVLFKGIDGRWTSWFDKIAGKLYKYYYGLPEHQRPWTRGAWTGATFEYWACVAIEFNSTMAHHESTADQQLSATNTEQLRCAVENFSGHRDPVRDGSSPPLDEYSMVDIVSHVDLGRDWAFHEASFFFFSVDDAHKPIIDRFGRYPYRNAIEGRDSTLDEVEWIQKTAHFAEASPEVAKRVKQDMAARRWTPLGEGEGEGEVEERPQRDAAGNLAPDASLNIAIRIEPAKKHVKQDEFQRLSGWSRYGMSCAK